MRRDVSFPLKRFLAFAYETYYPGGGLSDCIHTSDDLEECFAALREVGHFDFRFVVDGVTGEEHEL